MLLGSMLRARGMESVEAIGPSKLERIFCELFIWAPPHSGESWFVLIVRFVSDVIHNGETGSAS